jgi:hypothetical protein
MRFSRPVELAGKLDEVFVVAGEEDVPLRGCEAELVAISYAPAAQLMHVGHVKTEPTHYLGRPGLQVLVQEKSKPSGSPEVGTPGGLRYENS